VKVRKATGIPCVIYDWRHTFATRAANGGMSLGTLARILGHNSLRSVTKYVHPAGSARTGSSNGRIELSEGRAGRKPDGSQTQDCDAVKTIDLDREKRAMVKVCKTSTRRFDPAPRLNNLRLYALDVAAQRLRIAVTQYLARKTIALEVSKAVSLAL